MVQGFREALRTGACMARMGLPGMTGRRDGRRWFSEPFRQPREDGMQRMGMVIGLNPDKVAEYKRLHAAVWPEILALISDCNIKNYSIYLKEPENIMFSYFEYHGTDYDADMAKMAANPRNKEWWAVCMPCQKPLETRKEGEWWASMQEVFHLD
jgi:L-rhamnose mutarotase